jgi:hypothetical protein
MHNFRYSLYENDALVYQEDTRLVSVCAERKVAEIRYKCANLITATGIDWMVQREVSGGKPVPQNVKDLCASYRAMSNELEQRVAEVKTWASSDEDKSTCDTIEAIAWNE